jgi:hypothetical protein
VGGASILQSVFSAWYGCYGSRLEGISTSNFVLVCVEVWGRAWLAMWDLKVADRMRIMLVGGGVNQREILLSVLDGASDGDALGVVSFLWCTLDRIG